MGSAQEILGNRLMRLHSKQDSTGTAYRRRTGCEFQIKCRTQWDLPGLRWLRSSDPSGARESRPGRAREGQQRGMGDPGDPREIRDSLAMAAGDSREGCLVKPAKPMKKG